MSASAGATPSRSVTRVADEIERMIASGELLPGQPIRQALMAERLGVSRLPVREALRQLNAQGIVGHQHNAGYTVARLDRDEFDQIYLMRRALETEVLARLPRFESAGLEEVRHIAGGISDAAARGDILTMRLENQRFHFAMFERSGLHLVVAELRRLWKLSMPYHAAYLYDPAGRERVCAEHDDMIDALTAGDNERLIDLMDQHRHGNETTTGMLLGGETPRALRNSRVRPAAHSHSADGHDDHTRTCVTMQRTHPHRPGHTDGSRTPMADPALIADTVNAYIARLSGGRAPEIAALYADDATLEDPAGSEPRAGRAAIEEFYGALEQVQTRATLLTLRISGNTAAFHFRVETDLPDRTVVIEPIDVMTFDDTGAITSMRAVWAPSDMSETSRS